MYVCIYMYVHAFRYTCICAHIRNEHQESPDNNNNRGSQCKVGGSDSLRIKSRLRYIILRVETSVNTIQFYVFDLTL